MIKGTQKLFEEMEIALDAMVGRGPATEDEPKKKPTVVDKDSRDGLLQKHNIKLNHHDHESGYHQIQRNKDVNTADHGDMDRFHSGKAVHHNFMVKGPSLENHSFHKEWFDELSSKEKKEYLTMHPGSKYATGKQESKFSMLKMIRG